MNLSDDHLRIILFQFVYGVFYRCSKVSSILTFVLVEKKLTIYVYIKIHYKHLPKRTFLKKPTLVKFVATVVWVNKKQTFSVKLLYKNRGKLESAIFF